MTNNSKTLEIIAIMNYNMINKSMKIFIIYP